MCRRIRREQTRLLSVSPTAIGLTSALGVRRCVRGAPAIHCARSVGDFPRAIWEHRLERAWMSPPCLCASFLCTNSRYCAGVSPEPPTADAFAKRRIAPMSSSSVNGAHSAVSG